MRLIGTGLRVKGEPETLQSPAADCCKRGARNADIVPSSAFANATVASLRAVCTPLVCLGGNAAFMPASICFSRLPQQLAGEPVINTELSRTRAEQPDKEDYVKDFRKVEEIVEPVKKRKSFRHGE